MKKLLLTVMLLSSTQGWSFGYRGSYGSDGKAGSSGRDGQSITTVASGSYQEYILNGGNGEPGGNASAGGNAYSCSYSEGHSNEYGADGGDGGDGGAGGHGGNGGDVLVYYTNLSDVKNIYIQSHFGYGAQGGYGSHGGYGCACSSYSWSRESCSTSESCSSERICEANGETRTQDGVTAPVRVCHDRRTCTPVTSCSTNTYYCSSGSSGRSGKDGRAGSNGRMGILRLVKDLTALPSESPQFSSDLIGLTKTKALLSKRLWDLKKGALDLVMTGSVLDNHYYEFKELAQAEFRIVWADERSLLDFKDNQVSLSFDGKQIHFKITGPDFLKYSTKTEGKLTTLTIEAAYKKAEISNLEIGQTLGSGNNLKLHLVDRSQLSELVATKIKLQLVYKPTLLGWRVIYDTELPQEALEVKAGQIVVNIGKLGINPKFIKSGRKVRYTFWIERSFGNNKTSLELHQSEIKLR
jgi:hypothetical protein